jgi:hypothetical protein
MLMLVCPHNGGVDACVSILPCQLAELREEAQGLPSEVLVVLVSSADVQQMPTA